VKAELVKAELSLVCLYKKYNLWWWKFIHKYYSSSNEFYILIANYRGLVSVLICSEVELFSIGYLRHSAWEFAFW